jgi:methylmalonyl-CoA carboxyltransferase 5S subunit
MDKLLKIRDHFAKIRPRYKAFESATLVDVEILLSQIPGGMLSNLEAQLKAQGAGDKLHEVNEEIPKVKAAAGHPPLVTPTSQIVGTQAVFNVLFGPYKKLTGEFADLMLGYYGETIGPHDPAVVKIAEEQTGKKPITVRPADLMQPEWDHLDEEAKKLEGHDGSVEDTLTYAMFPQVAPGFFKTRDEGPKSVAMTEAQLAASKEAKTAGISGPVKYNVTLGGRTHAVAVEPA